MFSLFKRSRPVIVGDFDLSVWEFNALATYNAERARGILHSAEWQAKMEKEQKRFNERKWGNV